MNLLQRTYLRRLVTFEGWNGAVSFEDVAEAGFVYTGSDDKVKCPKCDAGLMEWKTTDVPWYEHRKHSPDCHFVRDYYGLSYKVTSDEVVDYWMKSTNMKMFIKLNLMDKKEIRKILQRRYQKTRKEFASFRAVLDYFTEHLYGKENAEEKQKEILNQITIVEDILTKYECKICYANEVEVMYSPCNHVVACEDCSKKLNCLSVLSTIYYSNTLNILLFGYKKPSIYQYLFII